MKTAIIKQYASIVSASWNILSFSAADRRITPQKNLCIVIEKHWLSIGYGSRSLSGIKIKEAKYFPSGEHLYPQPKELASAAVIAIEELGATGREVTLSIPRAWTIIKTTEFPSIVKEEIVNVVAYELDRLMPLHPCFLA